MGRTIIGSSDYARSIYSFDESAEPDPELTHFSVDHDRAYILPTLRSALELNPDLFLFSAPWSPPAWMKFNNSMQGGSMHRTYFASYAQYSSSSCKPMRRQAYRFAPQLSERSGYGSERHHARLHLGAAGRGGVHQKFSWAGIACRVAGHPDMDSRSQLQSVGQSPGPAERSRSFANT